MHPLDNLTFNITMKSGVPVVSKEAFKVLSCFVDEGRKTIARNFGKSLYFVCEMCEKITLLKYAVMYKGMLVSSKFLRKYQRQKLREQLQKEKYEMKKAARKAKSEQEFKKIREDYDLAKLKVKEKLNLLTYGPGELKNSAPVSPRERSPRFVDRNPRTLSASDYQSPLNNQSSLGYQGHSNTLSPSDNQSSLGSSNHLDSTDNEIKEVALGFVESLLQRLGPGGLIADRKKFKNSMRSIS